MGVFNFKKQEEKTQQKGTNKSYLTGKEIREIAKANQAEMRRLEKAKNRKADPSEYTTSLKDTNNILEVENLHSYFFTDQGVVKAVNGVTFNIPLNSTVGVLATSHSQPVQLSDSLRRLAIPDDLQKQSLQAA